MGRKPKKKPIKRTKYEKSTGARLMYRQPARLQKRVDEYFEWVKGDGEYVTKTIEYFDKNDEIKKKTVTEWVWHREPEPIMITGLALYLGFCSRQSLYEYAEMPAFASIIKTAMTRVESNYEKILHTKDKPIGALFALKQMKWSDRQDISQVKQDGTDADTQPVFNLTVVQPKQD